MNRVEIKQRAKQSLKNKYGDAILLTIISFAIGFGVSSIISFIGLSRETTVIINSLATIIISGLMDFGIFSYYLKVSRNESVSFKELFSKTNMFWPYIAISLLTGLFTMLWGLLFIIPGIIASLNYSLVYYIKLDNPELSAMEVIKESKKMMNGHKVDLFVLGLSFIGWIILGIFTLGILYLWLMPYMQVTYANFYNKLKEKETTI